MSRKKESSFHNPFAAAKEQLARVVPPPVVVDKKRDAPVAKVAVPTPPRDEATLFADEMLGVARLDEDRRGRVRAPAVITPPVSRRAADDAEAYASLADLVDGQGAFDVSDTDEYLEGIAPGLDKRIVKRLRKGDYALEAHVDLHGMTRDEARTEVERFLVTARAAGKRCVLIVHGRGLHSKDQVPVLKERIKVWLERGRVARSVLAFTSARQCDGGAGAVYVLLRK